MDKSFKYVLTCVFKRWMLVEHYVTRVVGTVKLLVQLDLFERTSELARLFGIQFYEVLSRGSQVIKLHLYFLSNKLYY